MPNVPKMPKPIFYVIPYLQLWFLILIIQMFRVWAHLAYILWIPISTPGKKQIWLDRLLIISTNPLSPCVLIKKKYAFDKFQDNPNSIIIWVFSIFTTAGGLTCDPVLMLAFAYRILCYLRNASCEAWRFWSGGIVCFILRFTGLILGGFLAIWWNMLRIGIIERSSGANVSASSGASRSWRLIMLCSIFMFIRRILDDFLVIYWGYAPLVYDRKEQRF